MWKSTKLALSKSELFEFVFLRRLDINAGRQRWEGKVFPPNKMEFVILEQITALIRSDFYPEGQHSGSLFGDQALGNL